MHLPAAHADYTADAQTEVDYGQVDYFLGLLTQICRRVNYRIDAYQRGGTRPEAGGYVDYDRGFQGMACIEEQDRRMLEGLIDRLQRRSTPQDRGEVPPLSRGARLMVR